MEYYKNYKRLSELIFRAMTLIRFKDDRIVLISDYFKDTSFVKKQDEKYTYSKWQSQEKGKHSSSYGKFYRRCP